MGTMSRSRFGWVLGLSAGLGFVVALLVRVVHGRRSELDAAGHTTPRVDATDPALPRALALPDPVVVGDVVIDLTDGATWTAPVDGSCPEGFPIKAKLTSGIFHLPGMAAYARTNPDRCYATADDALADGLRAAKR